MFLGAIDSFICLKTVSILVEIHKKKSSYLLVFIGCFLLVNMIIFVGDFANLPPTLFIFIIMLVIGCNGSLQQRISVALVFCSCVLAFNACLDNFLTRDLRRGRSLFSLLFWLFLYWGLLKAVPSKKCILPDKLWTLIGMLALTPLGIVVAVVLLGKKVENDLKVFVLLLIAVFTVIALFWVIAVMSNYRKLEEKQLFNQMNQTYYHSIENEQFEVRRLRHDMANHLSVLSALPDDQIRVYLDELVTKIEESQKLYFCANLTVNAVLAAKSSLMEKDKICFDYKAVIPVEINVQQLDLSALFSNSLDNAIEACLKLPEELRWIHLIAKTERGLFMLQIENPYGEVLNKDGTKIKTTKKDRTQHGFGLRSINEIVERYGGSMKIKTEDAIFSILLYLPLKP